MYKFSLSLILSTLFSLLAMYLALRNVPLNQLFTYMHSFHYIWILPTIAIILLSFVLRAVRWRVIISASRQIGFWDAYHPLMIGFMINCILPGRVGEFARPAILHKKKIMPFTAALATIASERIFDLIFLLVLLSATLSMITIDPSISKAFGGYTLNKETLIRIQKGMIQVCAALIVFILFIAVNKTREGLMRAIERAPSLLSFGSQAISKGLAEKICRPINHIIENIAAGFDMLKDPVKTLLCLAYTIVIWCLVALSYYVFSFGAPGLELSIFEMTMVMIIICFFIALPSVPGYWGLWEAGGVFALALFAVPENDSAGFTLVNHAIQIMPVILAGLISALITGVNIFQVSYPTRK